MFHWAVRFRGQSLRNSRSIAIQTQSDTQWQYRLLFVKYEYYSLFYRGYLMGFRYLTAAIFLFSVAFNLQAGALQLPIKGSNTVGAQLASFIQGLSRGELGVVVMLVWRPAYGAPDPGLGYPDPSGQIIAYNILSALVLGKRALISD